MSSLRLALKQSLQETAAPGAGSSSEENEFNGGDDEDNHTDFDSSKRQEQDHNWKVPPPSERLSQRFAALGTAARDHVVAGLRVKVQFDGKYWYGGRISAVSKDAGKIRIQYDDGSTEVSRFPDGVIIDATENGKHDANVVEKAKYFEGVDQQPLDKKQLTMEASVSSATKLAIVQQPTTPKPEKKLLELTKSMAYPDANENSPISSAKLTIGVPRDITTTSSSTTTTAATPKSPQPGTPGGIPKRKRGRPRKHPLPADSPHIPKKKLVEAQPPKKLSIRIPVPDKVKQSLQTPKDASMENTSSSVALSKKPSPSPRVGKKIKQKRSTEEDETSRNNHGKSKKRPVSDTDDIIWVQCDACSKWRIIPKSAFVGQDEKWYCKNNVYDPKRASCDVPQQALKYKKKRQRIIGEQHYDTPELPNDGDATTMKQHPPPPDEPARSSPPSTEDDEKVKQQQQQQQQHYQSRTTTSTTTTEEPVVVAKRGRGRPRRNKEIVETTIAETADNLEWVQCETCGKWRKIAPHISATDLPEVWTCSMNDWNIASASCDAPEDKADGLQDTGVFGTSGSGGDADGSSHNKMTYRHLIFGSTGRRVNRPVSERTRAAESIFSVQFDEEDAPSKVLYADSSAFVSRSRSNHLAENSEDRVSVLQLMSKSNLWKELQAASKSISSSGVLSRKNPPNLSVYSYENLPRDVQQPMKELVLFLLSYESYSVEEIVKNGRSMGATELPEGCRKAQVALTDQVVCTTLYQLVKEGKVECVDRHDTKEQCYRLFLANRADSRRLASRCLKISKPWKRRPHGS